jgi:hypothetical protein
VPTQDPPRCASFWAIACLVAACGSEPREHALPEPRPSGRAAHEPGAGPRAPAVLPRSTPTSEPAVASEAPDPLLDALAEPPRGREPQGALPAPLADRPAPAHGCALQSEAPLTVLRGAGPPAVLAIDDAFVIAAYEGSRAQVVRVRPGALPEPTASIALDGAPPRDAAPGLARLGLHEVALAMVDGRGRLVEASFAPALRASAPRAHTIADGGADPRFAPAIRALGTRHVIAWTDGSATPMRLRLAVVEQGAVVARHDVTPVAGGGAAPFFVEGEREPVLFFLDPRVGISVAHHVRIADDGTPGPTEIARPLNLAAEPPAIAVARARSGSRTWLAYAAVGNFATRAVGLVDAVGSERPAPLVPGLGYGDPLALDAVAAEASAVFAAEAPSAAPPDAPHEIRIRVVSEAGVGEPLVIAAPAADPALARRDDGLIAIAYRSEGEVRVHFLRCAD